LVNRLAGAYRATHERVAVVAVDPSSPFSGGAILGDRIRMRERFLDEGLFIRSMATRGHSGGLARATSRIVNVLDALGYGVVLVETVGVGQEEVEVVRVADTVCLVTVPGLGDDIQAIKAGVLEIADVLVVNKADRPGADETARDLAQMLTLGAPRIAWKPPIIRTVAATGEGTDELVAAIAKHRAWASESGEREARRRAAARAEVEALLRESLVRRLRDRLGEDRVESAIARVAERRVDPYAAVDELLRE
jgi:LAO/AO transport system kinase